MRVGYVRLTDADTRYFKIEDGYRYGHYLERDKPAPHNTRAILVIYRVPAGTAAPQGKLSILQLERLAEQAAKTTEPEVIARFPYWSFIGEVIDVPDDTPCEPAASLPASQRDAQQAYVLPPDPYTPIAETKPVEKSAEVPAKAKGG